MRGILFLSSLVLALLSAEIILRVWDPLRPEKGHSYLERVKKGKNSLGLRGKKEYPLEHENFRVLAVGDSFTYGLQLHESGSWPRQLETILRRHDPTIEVLNGARPGTSTHQQYRLYTRLFHNYKPDLVIIGFLLNDCTKLCSNCGPVELKKKVERMINRPTFPEKMSYLYKLYRVGMTKRRLTEETIKLYKTPYELNLPSYQECTAAFADFKKKADQDGFRLLVVIYPMLFGLQNAEYPFAAEHRKISEYLQSIGVEVLDLTPAFKGNKDTDLWVQPTNSHPNRKANAIAAETVGRYLLENNLLVR